MTLFSVLLFAVVFIGVILFSLLSEEKKDARGVRRMETVAGAYVPVKEGVNVSELDPVLGEAIDAARSTGALTPVITSALRPYDDGSLHAERLALDFRSRHLTSFEAQKVGEKMQERLGDDWDVVVEFNPRHIHVEYDPAGRKGKR
mgnify:CR=1 FL=1